METDDFLFTIIYRLQPISSALSFLSHVRRYDWIMLGAVFLLMALGLLSLFSLSDVSAFPFFRRQIMWTAAGLVFFFVFSAADFRIFRVSSVTVFLFYVLSVLLLSAVLIADVKIRGAASWLTLSGFTIQPVEIAKLSLIILLAKFFSKRHIEIYRFQHLAVSGLYAAAPAILVLLQPNLGSAIVLFFIWIAVVLFSGMKFRHFVLLIFIAGVVSWGSWHFVLHPYQQKRITSFFDPYADPRGGGYQMIQSMVAVGSGQIWGKGLGYGSQSHLHFLPEPETDFIFATYAEEWGFVGTLVLMSALTLFLWRVVRIGGIARDNFSRLYSIGFAALVFSQSFIHIGMNMGVVPITGITLPFVSYGGSSLVVMLAGVGILQSIKINARRDLE